MNRELDNHEHDDGAAPVVYLPHAHTEPGPEQSQQQRDGDVLEGELVTDAEYRALTTERDKALDRWSGYRRDLVTLGRASRTVATHHRTKTAAQVAGRHVVYTAGGIKVLAQRVWEAKSNSRYERQMRAAEARGDQDGLREWEARAEQAKHRRHERIMDWVKAPGQLAKAFAVGMATVTGMLLGLGILLALATQDASAVLDPIQGVLTLVRWTVTVVTVVWGPLVLAAPWAAVLGLWWLGRRHSAAPSWLLGAQQGGQAYAIDETVLARALAHLGIKPLADYLKDGVLTYTVLPHRERGDVGVSAQIRMPSGVTADKVVEAKKMLAGNLGRAAVEVWPSTGTDEALLDLWIADHGSLNQGGGAWPWLERPGAVDAYQGIPTGLTLRGDQIMAPVDGASYLVGGRPGQGKSTFTRLLVCGACLDPTAEIWCYVLADNRDFDPISERFTRYQVGAGQDVIEASLAALHEIMAEIERRGQIMREKGADTAAEAGLPPLVVALDEIHRLFQHRDKQIRDDAAAVAEDVARLARKYGILTIYATQSADASSIPKGVTRAVLQRVAFSVIDQQANDALLGTSSHRSGIRATELRPGTKANPGDRGKAVTVGMLPEADWAMHVTYYVSAAEAAQIGTRAMKLLAEAGATVATRTEQPTNRDLLDDLSEVLGDETVPGADVVGALQTLAPQWSPYQQLTKKKLAEQLGQLGVRVPATGNRYPVDPAAVRDALARRSTADLDEES